MLNEKPPILESSRKFPLMKHFVFRIKWEKDANLYRKSLH